jgi:hypothetical protein
VITAVLTLFCQAFAYQVKIINKKIPNYEMFSPFPTLVVPYVQSIHNSARCGSLFRWPHVISYSRLTSSVRKSKRLSVSAKIFSLVAKWKYGDRAKKKA